MNTWARRRKFKTELAHCRERAEHVAARASGFVSRAERNVRERVGGQTDSSWDSTQKNCSAPKAKLAEKSMFCCAGFTTLSCTAT